MLFIPFVMFFDPLVYKTGFLKVKQSGRENQIILWSDILDKTYISEKNVPGPCI